MTNEIEFPTFSALVAAYGLTIRSARLDKWRLTYPNAGELDGFPHFGKVLIMATDGTEAYFHTGERGLFHGHLKSFNGPVAKAYVWSEDWDFNRRKHRVNVFRRRDGSLVIIPTDEAKTSYWENHSKWSEEEKEAFMAIGEGRARVDQFDEIVSQLRASRSLTETKSKPRKISPLEQKRKELLASL